ncbi:MAG: tRNA (N(6)-L-threonylcarbamoyladenosine(37)-C(2))-methylthiotransferase MtaB [Treponema sp.]
MDVSFYSIRVETLGCRLNQVESESFASFAIQAGFSIYNHRHDTSSSSFHYKPLHAKDVKQQAPYLAAYFVPQHATPAEDVILCFVNTCTVTSKAEQKARRLIRLLTHEHPYAVILVTGCYAQLNPVEIETIHPHVIAFPGQRKGELALLPAFLVQLLNSASHIDSYFFISAIRTHLCSLKSHSDIGGQIAFTLNTPQFLFHSRALIKIQDGCNNNCSYCCIKFARGKSVALPAKEILHRVQQIEKNGIFEVTLSGVNLSQYTSDEGDFVNLLKLLLANTHIRIRISSLYPDRIDDALAEVLAHPQICPHFHLSVQSGSNTILRAMKRTYTRDTIYQAVERVRLAKKDPFIGADIITGFPGETDHDFEDTYTLCRELNLTGIHAFPFSPRPGTAAWNMKPKIPERIANERVKLLHILAQKQEEAYRSRWEGKIVYAITETSAHEQTIVTTENYISLPLKSKEKFNGGEALYVRICKDHAELVRDIKQ